MQLRGEENGKRTNYIQHPSGDYAYSFCIDILYWTHDRMASYGLYPFVVLGRARGHQDSLAGGLECSPRVNRHNLEHWTLRVASNVGGSAVCLREKK